MCLIEEKGGRIKCTRGKLPRFLEMRDGEGGVVWSFSFSGHRSANLRTDVGKKV